MIFLSRVEKSISYPTVRKLLTAQKKGAFLLFLGFTLFAYTSSWKVKFWKDAARRSIFGLYYERWRGRGKGYFQGYDSGSGVVKRKEERVCFLANGTELLLFSSPFYSWPWWTERSGNDRKKVRQRRESIFHVSALMEWRGEEHGKGFLIRYFYEEVHPVPDVVVKRCFSFLTHGKLYGS